MNFKFFSISILAFLFSLTAFAQTTWVCESSDGPITVYTPEPKCPATIQGNPHFSCYKWENDDEAAQNPNCLAGEAATLQFTLSRQIVTKYNFNFNTGKNTGEQAPQSKITCEYMTRISSEQIGGGGAKIGILSCTPLQ